MSFEGSFLFQLYMPSEGGLEMRVIYLVGGIASLAVFVILVRVLSQYRLGRISTLAISFLPCVFLGMIRIRCKFDGFNCGWMSFSPGITWHIIPAALIIVLIAWTIYHLGMTEAAKPLTGAWLALVWYSLPVSVIHPPSHGGPCPNIPIICHDLPLLGMGGLFYWLLPFVLWAMFRVGAQLVTGSWIGEWRQA